MLTDKAINSDLRASVKLCADYVTTVHIASDVCRDRDIELLKQLPLLTHLTLTVCKRLTDESLLHISKMSSLETLDLSSLCADAVTVSGLMLLSRLKKIELIRLPFLGMKEDEIKAKLQRVLPNTIIK